MTMRHIAPRQLLLFLVVKIRRERLFTFGQRTNVKVFVNSNSVRTNFSLFNIFGMCDSNASSEAKRCKVTRKKYSKIIPMVFGEKIERKIDGIGREATNQKRGARASFRRFSRVVGSFRRIDKRRLCNCYPLYTHSRCYAAMNTIGTFREQDVKRCGHR